MWRESGKSGMAESSSSKLQLWDGWARTEALAAPSLPPFSAEWDHPDQLYLKETLNPAAKLADETPEPFSLQWFLDIEHQRHHRYARWLPMVLEFNKHAGETLLGLGTGLGTDWVQYARQGASVIVCSPSAEQITLVRRNFELRELPVRFVQAMPASLPIDAASIDVVCLSSLVHQVRDPEALIHEVYRVLKPGGKVLAVTPARYDIDFWRRLLLPWRWRLWSSHRPVESGFTKRQLRGLFHQFVDHHVHKRHLRRADVPHAWRLLSTRILERMIGRTLILKAFKPLSSAISVPLAA
jgi:ubiquinone/menaquinone biosynthesis C-methylase UbiE